MAGDNECFTSTGQTCEEENYLPPNTTDESCLPLKNIAAKRQSWARKSREMKKNPSTFPVSSDNSKEEPATNKESTEKNDISNDETVSENEEGDEFFFMPDSRDRKCKCFIRVSLNIDSVDEIDGVCGEGKTECLDALSFLQNVPAETRQQIAKYLSTGNPEHLKTTKENLHHIFHLAKILNLQQLYNQCMLFCSTEIGNDVTGLFGGCQCEEDIVQESKTGYQRFVSVVESEDENASPEFYIVFSTNGLEEGDKNTVMVIDMSEKLEIFQRNTERLQQLGVGSDCCCAYKKDSPYIFACGGEGKFAQALWKYDVLLGRWQKCSKMLNKRFKHSLISDRHGSLFAIGGTESARIDEYNICTNKWLERVPLAKHVHSTVCAMYKDKIYIFGGQTSAGPVASVQCYDTDIGIVTCLADLPCAFYGGQVVVYKNKIFIATRQGHMICFEPETGKSHLCSHQPVQRDHFGMFLKRDRLYLVGGVTRDGDDDSTPLYRYNPVKDTWNAEENMCKSFPVYSSCVIRYPRYCPVVPFSDKL